MAALLREGGVKVIARWFELMRRLFSFISGAMTTHKTHLKTHKYMFGLRIISGKEAIGLHPGTV
ncbi:MAG: hypothetical protein F6J92_28170 [Symploca sp. SIO1A3]|nr:hypothetical protein [Symploca sp. SIO1A3]